MGSSKTSDRRNAPCSNPKASLDKIKQQIISLIKKNYSYFRVGSKGIFERFKFKIQK